MPFVYCEIFHTYKPTGLLLDGLYNVNLRYQLRKILGKKKLNKEF